MPKRKNNKKGGCVKSSIQKGGDAWTNDFSNLIGHKATTINRVTNCPKINNAIQTPAPTQKYFPQKIPIQSNTIKCNQLGAGYHKNLNSNIAGKAKIISDPQCIPPVLNNSNVPEIVDLNRQLGGSYMFIINPKTNRKVNIMGKLGKKIIKNYFLQLNLI